MCVCVIWNSPKLEIIKVRKCRVVLIPSKYQLLRRPEAIQNVQNFPFLRLTVTVIVGDSPY